MRYCDLACIRCGKALTPSGPDFASTPPGDALIFMARGNYGSTIYDPQSEMEYLIVVICDPCVVAQAAGGNVMRVQKRVAPPPRQEPWTHTPYEEPE